MKRPPFSPLKDPLWSPQDISLLQALRDVHEEAEAAEVMAAAAQKGWKIVVLNAVGVRLPRCWKWDQHSLNRLRGLQGLLTAEHSVPERIPTEQVSRSKRAQSRQ